jgi:hypothetical protein
VFLDYQILQKIANENTLKIKGHALPQPTKKTSLL